MQNTSTNLKVIIPETWLNQDFETWFSIVKVNNIYNNFLRTKN